MPSIFAFSIKPEQQIIQSDINYAAERGGGERDEYIFSSEYFANWKEIEAYTGLQNYHSIFDFTIGADYFPSIFRHDFTEKTLSVGFGGIYHFQNQRKIAYENDLVFNSYFKILTQKKFSFTAILGYGRKYAIVHELSSDALIDNTVMMGILLDKKFSNDFEIHYYLRNFDMYRFYLFDSTVHDFGCSGFVTDKIKIGGDLELKYPDQFGTAPYLNGLWLKFSAAYYF